MTLNVSWWAEARSARRKERSGYGTVARFGPGNPGRPKGAKNKATRDIQAFSREMLERPEYVAALQLRIDEGKAPHMETLLAHYAYGKPKDTLAIEKAPPLMVVDELTGEDVSVALRERDA